MQSPKTPRDEAARLFSLQKLNILDTHPEERFDRITRLAKKLFNVPIALISLIDKDRQWFKSHQGLEAKEIPREVSFCGHTILDSDIVVVENTLEDERFSNNPLVVKNPNIHFYAGYPLKCKDNLHIGTLCIMDHEPRQFSSEDQEALRDLAKVVERELKTMAMSMTDNLTGISNKLGFFELAKQALSLCKRAHKSLTLLKINLDHFKIINENFGHEEGDHVLKDMANILQRTFRQSDVIARLNGDEFAVLCTYTEKEDIPTLLVRLHRSVYNYNQNNPKQYILDYSIGAVEFSATTKHNLEHMAREASLQMYLNKEHGRIN